MPKPDGEVHTPSTAEVAALSTLGSSMGGASSSWEEEFLGLSGSTYQFGELSVEEYEVEDDAKLRPVMCPARRSAEKNPQDTLFAV